jgi:hypothetical protein
MTAIVSGHIRCNQFSLKTLGLPVHQIVSVRLRRHFIGGLREWHCGWRRSIFLQPRSALLSEFFLLSGFLSSHREIRFYQFKFGVVL